MPLDDALMWVLHNLVLAGAAVGLYGMLCRLNTLHYRAHRPSIVLMHVALAGACVMAGAHALAGETDPGDVAIVVAAMGWLRASYRTWKDGVPAIYNSGPVPLDDEAISATRPPAA